MPTYDYSCTHCGHKFDVFQSIKDEPLTTCPSCGTPSLKRLIGKGGGILFKGTGFYLTDYKRSSASPSTGSASSSSPEGGADSAKSDSGASGSPPKKDAGSGGSGSKEPT